MVARFAAAWAAVALLAGACGPGELGRCGDQACGADQRCDQTAKLCVVDEAPTVTLAAPASNAAVTQNAVRVSGTARDDVRVDALEVSTDGATFRALTLAADGSFDADVPLPEADAAPVTLTVRALDEKQHAGSAQVTVQVDDVNPRCAVVAPAATNASGVVQIPVTYADGSGAPASAEASTDGATFSPVTITGGAGTFAWTVPGGNGASQTLTFRASDRSGHTCTASATVVVDTEPPTVAFAAPAADALLGQAFFAGQKVRLSAADGPGEVRAVSLDVGAGAELQAMKANDGLWELSVPAPAPALNGVARTWRATAEDRAGNRTTAQLPVRLDTVPPTLAFTTPAAGALLGPAFFSGGSGTVVLAADDDVNALPAVEVDPGTGAFAAAAHQQGSVWQLAFPSPTIDFADRTLRARARDLAGNTAEVSRTVKVDTVAPVLTITSPTDQQRLNIASFPSGDGAPVTFLLQDGDAQAKASLGGSVVTSPAMVPTASTDDAKSYLVTLTGKDSAGNSTGATVHFTVDRVAPRVLSLTPDAGSRMNAPMVSVQFSEPMRDTSPGLTLTPAAASAGSWAAPDTFTIGALDPDAVHTAATGAVSDLSGNPLAQPVSTHFHTAPLVPADGTVLATGVAAFQAASDEDGVLAVVTRASPTGPPTSYPNLAVRVNPRTGAVQTLWARADPTPALRTHALSWQVIRPDLSAERTQAAYYRVSALAGSPGPTDGAQCLTQSSVACSGASLAGLVLLPPVTGETDPARFGTLTATAYVRGAVSQPTHVAAPTLVGFAPRHFALYDGTSTPNHRDLFYCERSAFVPNPTTCSMVQEDVLNTDSSSSLSVAEGSPCTFLAYTSNTQGRVLEAKLHTYQACVGLGCVTGGFLEQVGASRPKLRVAATQQSSGTTVYGAWESSPGNVQLGVRTVSATCTGGSWLALGPPIATSAATWEPVSLGLSPGLLTLDGSGALTLRRP
ncbi:MAG: hypothetical protein K1X89_28970 [Myxococcaceae bacterium]|nr:hypothetical protein [Myxococcaceae bacterium]